MVFVDVCTDSAGFTGVKIFSSDTLFCPIRGVPFFRLDTRPGHIFLRLPIFFAPLLLSKGISDPLIFSHFIFHPLNFSLSHFNFSDPLFISRKTLRSPLFHKRKESSTPYFSQYSFLGVLFHFFKI